MLQIDTTKLRRVLVALATVPALALSIGTAACSGAANGSGGDPIDDPANVDHVDGYEGQDPGWDGAMEEATKAGTPDPGDGSGVGTSSEALTTGSANASTLYAEAHRELDTLQTSTSYYSHTTYMNESTGTRRTDCSGYLDYVLKRVLGASYDLVPHPNTYKPLADDWYNYFKSRSSSPVASGHWQRILRAQDLRAGDVVAWLPPPGQVTDDTGHVMIVRGTPTQSGRAGEWLVPIMDSTTSPHASDSRGTSHTGIGSGTIGLKVDSSGRPVAYYWRGGLSYNAYTTSIALGRVD